MATLSEVARRAGVTTATVSNVLRNPAKVKASTVERVQAAIAEVGYRPNLMARALAEGKSSMVALVLPSITNPFYPEFIRVAERVARQRQYFLMVCNTDEDTDIGRAYLNQIAGTLADGVLVLHTGVGPKEIRELGATRCPIVLALEEMSDLAEQIPHVVVDFHQAGLLAGRHLLDLGHRRIGAIVGRGCEGPQYLRLDGFKSALAERGLVFDEMRARSVPDSIAGGYEAAASLMESDPSITALFTTNDLLALGAANALADKGLRIPDDVSVIGLTDIQLASEMRPPLTTVSLGIADIARLSINLLLDLIENPKLPTTFVRTPTPVLVQRASTARAKGC